MRIYINITKYSKSRKNNKDKNKVRRKSCIKRKKVKEKHMRSIRGRGIGELNLKMGFEGREEVRNDWVFKIQFFIFFTFHAVFHIATKRIMEFLIQ